MSKRLTELTDPGPPPEDVLDATLRALGKPARPPPRQASESAGVDAAQYQADAHLPPKAHRPNGPIETMPMLRPPTESETREARSPSKAVQGLNLTTVPRGVPRGSKSGYFVVALLLVLLVVGGATWILSARDEAHGVPRSILPPVTPPSAAAMAMSPNEPPTAGTVAPSSVPAAPPSVPMPMPMPMPVPRSTPGLAAAEPSASATTPRASSVQSPFEPRPAAAPVASRRVASPVNTDKPVPTPTVAPPARPSASSRDDIPKDPL